MKTTINETIKQVAMTLLREGDLLTLRRLNQNLVRIVRNGGNENPMGTMSLYGDEDWKLASMFDSLTGWRNSGYAYRMYMNPEREEVAA